MQLGHRRNGLQLLLHSSGPRIPGSEWAQMLQRVQIRQGKHAQHVTDTTMLDRSAIPSSASGRWLRSSPALCAVKLPPITCSLQATGQCKMMPGYARLAHKPQRATMPPAHHLCPLAPPASKAAAMRRNIGSLCLRCMAMALPGAEGAFEAWQDHAKPQPLYKYSGEPRALENHRGDFVKPARAPQAGSEGSGTSGSASGSATAGCQAAHRPRCWTARGSPRFSPQLRAKSRASQKNNMRVRFLANDARVENSQFGN